MKTKLVTAKVPRLWATIVSSFAAQQVNELLFDTGDGKRLGFNRLELETYPPEDQQVILEILHDSYGEPTLGELNRGQSVRSTVAAPASAGGLTEALIDLDFAPLKDDGFLTAAVTTSECLDGFPPTKKSILDYAIQKEFLVSSSSTTIPNNHWDQYHRMRPSLSISYNYESPKSPGPAGSQVSTKTSLSANGSMDRRYYRVRSGYPHAGRTTTEYNGNANARVSGEVKVFWGEKGSKKSGKFGPVRYWIEVGAEMGLKASISTNLSVGNRFVDRNDSVAGQTTFGNNMSLSLTAYAELKWNIKYKLRKRGKTRGFGLSAGAEITGTVSLYMGFTGQDWDHTLASTHPSRSQTQTFKINQLRLSYNANAYLKFKIRRWEIKPSVRFSGSKSFRGNVTINLRHIAAIDKYM